MSHAYIEVTNIDANNYTVQYYLLPLATVKIMYFVLYNNALTLEVPCVRTGRTYAEVVLGFLTFHCSPQPVLKWCSYFSEGNFFFFHNEISLSNSVHCFWQENSKLAFKNTICNLDLNFICSSSYIFGIFVKQERLGTKSTLPTFLIFTKNYPVLIKKFL